MPVWQKALNLGLLVYEITKDFPDDEKFGLISDMKRAVNSITHNIAEGYGRYEPKDKTRFYKISRGSSFELMSQSIFSHKLGFIKNENLLGELISSSEAIIKDLNALIKSIECK